MTISPVRNLDSAEVKDRINQLISQVGGVAPLVDGSVDYLVRDRLNKLAAAVGGVSKLSYPEITRIRAKINELIAATGVPSWVSVLAAPGGILPRAALDFAHGRYWGAGALQTLTAMVVQDTNWGTWDPTAIAPGLGVDGDLSRSKGKGTIASAFFGPAFLTTGVTVLVNLVGGSTGLSDPDWGQSTIQWEIDLFERGAFANDAEMMFDFSAGPQPVANLFDFNNALQATQSGALASANLVSAAANLTVGAAGITTLGATPATGTFVAQNSPACTSIGFGNFHAESGNDVYLALLALYDAQPNSSLAAISRL